MKEVNPAEFFNSFGKTTKEIEKERAKRDEAKKKSDPTASQVAAGRAIKRGPKIVTPEVTLDEKRNQPKEIPDPHENISSTAASKHGDTHYLMSPKISPKKGDGKAAKTDFAKAPSKKQDQSKEISSSHDNISSTVTSKHSNSPILKSPKTSPKKDDRKAAKVNVASMIDEILMSSDEEFASTTQAQSRKSERGKHEMVQASALEISPTKRRKSEEMKDSKSMVSFFFSAFSYLYAKVICQKL